jgi:hypothetical protein
MIDSKQNKLSDDAMSVVNAGKRMTSKNTPARKTTAKAALNNNTTGTTPGVQLMSITCTSCHVPFEADVMQSSVTCPNCGETMVLAG